MAYWSEWGATIGNNLYVISWLDILSKSCFKMYLCIRPLCMGNPSLWRGESPWLLSHGVEYWPSFKINMWGCRDPNRALIFVSDVSGVLLKKERRGLSITVSIQLLMWDNSVLLSNLWAQRVKYYGSLSSRSLFTANNLESINEDAFLGLPHLEYL